jgi:hypothetical protein
VDDADAPRAERPQTPLHFSTARSVTEVILLLRGMGTPLILHW